MGQKQHTPARQTKTAASCFDRITEMYGHIHEPHAYTNPTPTAKAIAIWVSNVRSLRALDNKLAKSIIDVTLASAPPRDAFNQPLATVHPDLHRAAKAQSLEYRWA